MEPEGSLLHSQMPATCPYPEPARSSRYPHFLKIHLNTVLPSIPGPPKWSLSVHDIWLGDKTSLVDLCLLRYSAVLSGKQLLSFQRKFLPPSTGLQQFEKQWTTKALRMESASSSEMSGTIYQLKWDHILEDI